MNDDEIIPTRRSLVTRLKNWEDQEGWKDFFDTYWKLIYGVARKSDLGENEAQDVVQHRVLSIAKRMKDFKYDPERGSFKNWLLLITRRRIADHLRKQYRQPKQAEPMPPDQTRTAELDCLADPQALDLDALWEQEWSRNLIDAAIQRVKSKVPAKQFQIVDFYALKQWPVRKVASTLGVNIGQAYLAKHRVWQLVKKEVRNLERQFV